MSINHWFQKKWINRVRQFGIRAAFLQLFQATIRPIWMIKDNLIMAIPDHYPNSHTHPSEVSSMTPHKIEQATKLGELNKQQQSLLLNFLSDGCHGFFYMVDEHLAGYAFVQPSKTYIFAGSGRFQVPQGAAMLKNLFVLPQFRGYSLGKKLNQARLASIPVDQIPIVFVIPENRFAIRNLKMYGFEEMLTVTRTIWFKKWTSQRIRLIKDCEITQHLIKGLEGNS